MARENDANEQINLKECNHCFCFLVTLSLFASSMAVQMVNMLDAVCLYTRFKADGSNFNKSHYLYHKYSLWDVCFCRFLFQFLCLNNIFAVSHGCILCSA